MSIRRKRRTTASAVREVKALTARASHLSIAAACQRVGLSPATYYRHTASHERLKPRFPGVEADWPELTARYTPILPKRTPPTAVRHVRHSVGDVFRTVYSRPAGTETARQVAAGLDRFSRKLNRMISGYDDLSAQGKTALEVAATYTSQQGLAVGEALQLLRDLSEKLPEMTTAIADDRSVAARSGGGPLHDTRADTAVLRLATIFAQYVRQYPTHWRRADDAAGSAFNRFAVHAFEHFVGARRPSERSLSKAMAWVVQLVDFTSDIEGE